MWTRRRRKGRSTLTPARPAPSTRRKPHDVTTIPLMNLFLFILATFTPFSLAVNIVFENCLDQSIVSSHDPALLQWVPYFFDAKYIHSGDKYNLNLTTYGNVTGQATRGGYPPPDDPTWTDPKSNFGKLVNASYQDPAHPKYTTFYTKTSVLQYQPWSDAPGIPFCTALTQGECPVAPAFNGSQYDQSTLPGFTTSHDFFSPYSFTTFAATLRVDSGDSGAPHLACVSASITPYLGRNLSGVLRYLPLAILIVVGLAVIFAAVYSPWGSPDIFRWSSNYGRDEDQIRLVTPGFGDCLQYIQFVVLAGSLSLDYPGFYQPAISRTGWAVLMFNESFVSHGNGYQSLVDGIYVSNSTLGLERTSQLIGMTEVKDIWAGMAIWLLVIAATIIVLCQLGFGGRWLWRQISATQEEDLRQKNLPFTLGNIVRVVCNFFLLPIIALSTFQLVVARRSPAVVVAMAIVLIVAVFVFLGWIFRMILTTRPRAHLFDDLPTVLRYGPLYNTYSDEAAPFAFVPIFVTVVRGIAIGAVQQSGIAQIVILAIGEVVLILTLNAFRPYRSQTSMNAYQTLFASIRLATTLLMTAFVPSLGVTEAPKGWIGYIILVLHAIVLIFGFLGNALLRVLEVVARMAGLGADREAGAQRGGLGKVFGVRQLSRRNRRRGPRSSMTSDAAILTRDEDQKSQLGRTRSLSASSTILLQQQMQRRPSTGFDQLSEANSGPGTPGGSHSPFPHAGTSASGAGSDSAGPSARRGTSLSKLDQPNYDPYYRPPRARRATGDEMTPQARSRGSWASGDWVNKPYHDSPESGDIGGGIPDSPQAAGAVAGRGHQRDESSPNMATARRSNQDYAVREVDFYYGVRGPALSNLPTRKLKTGPADPTGPVSSATGWFRNLFSGKTKDKGKGFEVVRSTRAPPPMMPTDGAEDSPQDERFLDQPYRDSPGPSPAIGRPNSHGFDFTDDDADITRGRPMSSAYNPPHHDSDSEDGSVHGDPFNLDSSNRVSAVPPLLGPIETEPSIHIPSRFGSQHSTAQRAGGNQAVFDLSHELQQYPLTNPATSNNPLDSPASAIPKPAPQIPRKSSRRNSSVDNSGLLGTSRLSRITPTPPSSQENSRRPSPARVLDYGEADPGLNIPGVAISSDTPTPTQQKHRPQNLRVGGEVSGRMPFGSPGPSPGLTIGGSAASSRNPSDENMRSRSTDPSLEGEGTGRLEGRESSALGGLAVPGPLTGSVGGGIGEARPASLGVVQQHRAGEGMRRPVFMEDFGETQAEVVQGISPASSRSRRGEDGR
ncbi:MAG: hypothetical protein M1820_007909 [Bogoriella megaspora]|nr:MAG: hypothetical protein M1820_007909 [Bogoriella megaspora]